jgi:pimeloyl-ACP methyl ester carboxylesterase
LTGATNSGAQPATRFAAAKPTIVLIHGAWAEGSSWAAVHKNLQSKGFAVDVEANKVDAPHLSMVSDPDAVTA